MPVLICGNEGEWSLFQSVLDATKGADAMRRGSVKLVLGQQMFQHFTPSSDIWVHVRFASEITQGGAGAGGGASVIQVRDANGNTMVDFQDDNTKSTGIAGYFFRRATTPEAVPVSTGELFTMNRYEFFNYDFNIKITTTTNPNDTIRYRFYRNEVLRADETSINAAGWAQPAQILLRDRGDDLDLGYDFIWFQDVIVTNGIPTVGMELATLIPNAQGFYTAFANDYTAINEAGYDQSTAISSTTPNERESWTFVNPTFNLGDRIIYAVAFDTVAQTDIGGIIADFEPFLRASAVDYAGAQLGANNISPEPYVTLWTANPDTGQPWTISDLDTLEAGVRSV